MAEVIDVALHGDTISDDGYSRVAKNFIRATRDRINFVPHPFYQRKQSLGVYENAKIAFHHNPAIIFNPAKSHYNILETMWETSKVSKQFLAKAKLADEVWCPTEYNAKAYAELSSDVPVRVVPYPLPIWNCNTKKAPHKSFRFLFVGTWYSRKGVDVMVEAFSQEFSKSDKVELWIKRNVWPQSKYITLTELCNKHKPEAAIFDVKHRFADMNELYAMCDCIVLSSRGEGFGMPPIEAGLCGLDVIVSDCSSLHDIFKDTTCRLVSGQETIVGDAWNTEPVVSNWVDPESSWFEPSVDDLRKHMRAAYETPQDHAESIKKVNDNGDCMVENFIRVFNEV